MIFNCIFAKLNNAISCLVNSLQIGFFERILGKQRLSIRVRQGNCSWPRDSNYNTVV